MRPSWGAMDEARGAITAGSYRALVRHACEWKKPYSYECASRVAWAKRQQGLPISAYPCPFAPGTGTWHVGHAPGMDTVKTLARFLRFGAAGGPYPSRHPGGSDRG